jgi:DNA-binding response OmpR family regulator
MTYASRTSILLVEDDQLLRGAFRLLLEDAGYQVREAGSAAEALRSIAGELPSLILLDLGLPDRPGLDVARIVRGQPATAAVPIIALTGHAGEADRQASIGAGCTFYFAKPVEPRLLLGQVTSLIGSARNLST